MTKDQIEQKIAELHEKAFALQKEIAEVEREVVAAKDWPVVADKYWYISGNGHVDTTIYDCNFDVEAKSIGNCFHSKEEANFAVERLKVLAEMRKFAFEPDWEISNQERYGLSYDGVAGEIILNNYLCAAGIYVFASESIALDCMRAIGKERLKKYYFGVKNDS